MTFAIGVDLGGTNLRIAAVDESGKLLEKVSVPTETGHGRHGVLDQICSIIQATSSKHLATRKLAGIGIGVPGIIDMETGMLRQSPNLPGWEDYPVRQEIEKRLSARVVLENDANAAALGEEWLGAAKDVDDMLMLTLGTGVGGGLVLGGRVWHGARGMAGEPGHINVVRDGHPCGCGSHGCLEQYASATAVVRLAREAIAGGKAPSLGKVDAAGKLTARAVFELAQQGDRPAQEVYKVAGRALGLALAGLVNLLNLPMYVVGGGVSDGWEAFAPAMFDEVEKRSFVYRATAPESKTPGRKTVIARALLGGDAGLFGAARLPMLMA
ncbi:MAG TPA: ROK family protein [Terriglobales bacterium]|jgi:glucokinase|nr:ROK family protein [Terriglobales bacterium]